MYNLLIAIAAGLATAGIIRVSGFGWLAAIVPAVLVFIGAYLLLARRIASKIQVLSGAAQKELSAAPTNVRERNARVEKAIKLLESGLVYDRWQFLIGSEIHAQIGMIKYMMRDFEGAQPHLAKANARNYTAKAIQAALCFQRKEYEQMTEYFEAAVRSGKKDGLIWSAYAWCLQQMKEPAKALKVMARAVEANPSDEKLKAGLTALQNDKKLKMKPYEPMWWQFGLEQPPMQMPPGGRRVQYQRH
jgi:tetratricopeptide (TPR) repeat protein